MNKVQNLTTKKERHCHKPMLCGGLACVMASVLAFLKQGSSLQQCLIDGVVETAEVYAKMAHNGWRYVFGLSYMAYRVTTTAFGKLKYTACYLLGGLISR